MPITGKRLNQTATTSVRKLYCCLATLVVATSAQSSTEIDSCLSDSAKRFGHHPQLLVAIGKVESGWNCAAVSKKNANGTVDIGCLQINSAWIPLLRSKFGIEKEDLLNPCININVGAWLLAKNKKTFGNNWRAIGAYNAKAEKHRISYAWKIQAKLGA